MGGPGGGEGSEAQGGPEEGDDPEGDGPEEGNGLDEGDGSEGGDGSGGQGDEGKGVVWAGEKEDPGSSRGAKGRRPQKR